MIKNKLLFTVGITLCAIYFALAHSLRNRWPNGVQPMALSAVAAFASDTARDATSPDLEPTTTQPSAAVGLNAAVMNRIHAKDAVGTMSALLKSLPLGSFDQPDEANSPVKVVYGANTRLRWVELIGAGGAGDIQCLIFFFTPEGHFICVQDVGECRLQKEPQIIADSKIMLYVISGEERGTEVGCTWVEVMRPPVREPDSKEWDLPTGVFQGRSYGYVGEWLSSRLMKICFPTSYRRSPNGDGQLFNFSIEYKLSETADGKITLHRTGSVSLSDQNNHETSAVVNERFIYDADTRQFVPLF